MNGRTDGRTDGWTDGWTDGRTDGRTDGQTDGRTENIYSIFRDKLLLLGEHVYDEDERRELFAYFVQGGSGQVLDNAHGNVFFGVANVTACIMHSLAWDDLEDKKRCSQRNKNINTRSGD